MIGYAIRKYAERHGMTCDGGYAYGKIYNRHVALEDRYGAKILQIYLHPPTLRPDACDIPAEQIQHVLLDCSARDYRLSRQRPVRVGGGRVIVTFSDNPGTIARVERYIDEMLPRLDALELNTDVCAYCGEPLTEEAHYALLDDFVLPVHGGCAREMVEHAAKMKGQPKSGSAVKGAFGALTGAILGAIPWMALHVLGYVTSACGLLIGFLSKWMYSKFGGKRGALRAVIVALAMVFGVVLGQVGGTTARFARNYDTTGGLDHSGMTCVQYVQCRWDRYIFADQSRVLGNVYDRLVSNLPDAESEDLIDREEYISMFSSDSYAADRAELLREFAAEMGMGIFFGLLGCAGLFAQLFHGKRMRTVRILK